MLPVLIAGSPVYIILVAWKSSVMGMRCKLCLAKYSQLNICLAMAGQFGQKGVACSNNET